VSGRAVRDRGDGLHQPPRGPRSSATQRHHGHSHAGVSTRSNTLTYQYPIESPNVRFGSRQRTSTMDNRMRFGRHQRRPLSGPTDPCPGCDPHWRANRARMGETSGASTGRTVCAVCWSPRPQPASAGPGAAFRAGKQRHARARSRRDVPEGSLFPVRHNGDHCSRGWRRLRTRLCRDGTAALFLCRERAGVTAVPIPARWH
jgi:hypothetical protein